MSDAAESTELQAPPAKPDPDGFLYAPIETFERVVELLKTRVGGTSLRLLTGPVESPLEFLVDEPELSRALSGANLELSDLRRVLFDLEDVLSALVSDVGDAEFAAFRNDADRWEDGEVEPVEIAQKKYRLAQSSFDIQDLRRRAWLKRNSKQNVLRVFRWEVSTKREDSSEPAPGGGAIRYATLRIESGPARARFSRNSEQVLVMMLDDEDVRYMQDSLTRLTAAMTAEGTE